jgi:hypothetical protein
MIATVRDLQWIVDLVEALSRRSAACDGALASQYVDAVFAIAGDDGGVEEYLVVGEVLRARESDTCFSAPVWMKRLTRAE